MDRGNRRKLNPRDKKSNFIRYYKEIKACLLMDLETRRVVRARSVTFNENILPDNFMAAREPLPFLQLSIVGCIKIEQVSTTTTSKASSALAEGDTAGSVGATEGDQIEEETVVSHSTDHHVQKSIETRQPTIRYGLAYTHDWVTGIQEPTG